MARRGSRGAYLTPPAPLCGRTQLPALLRVLVLQGHLVRLLPPLSSLSRARTHTLLLTRPSLQVVPPSERQGLHPLVVPLSRSSDGQARFPSLITARAHSTLSVHARP